MHMDPSTQILTYSHSSSSDCFGDMTKLRPVPPAHQRTAPGAPTVATSNKRGGGAQEWIGAESDLLVMGAIHRDGISGGISGRSDYRLHRSLDGGSSWKLLARVYPGGSVSYSGIQALNSTHVGVMYNAGPMSSCGAVTKFVTVCARCKGTQQPQ